MNNKRILSIMLCAVMLLSSGCAIKQNTLPNNDNADDHEQGYPSGSTEEKPHSVEKSYCIDYHYNTYYTFGTGNSIIETDDAIYYLYGNIVYYSDIEYKCWMPLCPRPDCAHDNTNCDAWVDSESGLWLYDRYIYYIKKGEHGTTHITHPILCRMRLDGTAHEEVMELVDHDFGYTPERNEWSYFFTNEYLSVTYASYREAMALPDNADVWYYSIDLSTMELFDVRAFDLETGATVMTAGLPLQGKEGVCYGIDTVNKTINCRDLKTGYAEILGNIDSDYRLLYFDGAFGFIGDDLLYVLENDEEKELYLYCFNINTRENLLLAQGNAYRVKWLCVDYENGLIFRNYCIIGPAAEGIDENEFGFYVFDKNLEPIDVFYFKDSQEKLPFLSANWQTDSFVFAFDFGGNINMNEAPPPTWYIDKADIGTGNLAWRRWEPYEH